MEDAVGLWVIVYFCVTSVNTKDWLCMLHLQQIRQRTEETVDNFVARIKLKAKKCGTRDNIEFEQRVIETIIAGIRYETVQRELLTKPKR